jgi:selenide,water dikinase
MARASKCGVALYASSIPFLPEAVELASMGMIPAGSFANRQHFAPSVTVADAVDPLLRDLVFDAQTSGGLLMSLPDAMLREVLTRLEDAGEMAAVVGEVIGAHSCGHLDLLP